MIGERLKLRKLNELEVRKQDRIETANMFAAFENLNDNENIKENIKTSAKESLGLYKLK